MLTDMNTDLSWETIPMLQQMQALWIIALVVTNNWLWCNQIIVPGSGCVRA